MLMLILSIIVSISQAVTAMVLWNLFLTPLGLPTIGFVMAIGIRMLVSILIVSQEEVLVILDNPARDKSDIPSYIGIALGYQILTVFGYLLSFFM